MKHFSQSIHQHLLDIVYERKKGLLPPTTDLNLMIYKKKTSVPVLSKMTATVSKF